MVVQYVNHRAQNLNESKAVVSHSSRSVQPPIETRHQVPVSSLAGAEILIAEDNLVNIEVATLHLENLGCSATTALGGVPTELKTQLLRSN